MQEELEGYNNDNFKYNLIDINNYTKEELLKEDTMFSKVAALEKCKTPVEIIETLNEIIAITKKDKEELYRIINYIFRQKIGDEETEKILAKLKEEEENSMVHELLEREFRKNYIAGRKEGKKEGKLAGKKEGKLEIAKEMKKQKYPDEIISKITKLEMEEIKAI